MTTYGDTTNIDVQPKSFPAGAISDNVRIISIAFDIIEGKAGGTYETILIKYQKQLDGNTMDFDHRIFPVNFDTSTDLEKDFDNFNNIVFHIANQFGIDKDTFTAKTKGTSFKDFASKFVNLLSSVLPSDELFYLKLVMNKAGYPTVPRFPDFLQKMSEGICSLKFSKYELGKIKEYKISTPEDGEINTEDADIISSLEDLIGS